MVESSRNILDFNQYFIVYRTKTLSLWKDAFKNISVHEDHQMIVPHNACYPVSALVVI